MPRKTHRITKRRQKARGLKRPRGWHRGPNRDAHFAEAERLFKLAEGEAA